MRQRLFSNPIIPATAGVILLTALQLFVFVCSPEERTMGISQRIFYLHVPLAWCAFLAFLVVFVASIFYLVKGTPFFDDIAFSSAVTGIVFNTLMLVTGSIWARAVWGAWWTWDARLTTSLVLWFVYACYLLVRNFGFEKTQAARFAAVIGITGFAGVPIVAVSIVLWRTQHPAALIFTGGLTSTMRLILIISLVAFSLLYVLLVAMGVSMRRLEDRVTRLEMRAGTGAEAGEIK